MKSNQERSNECLPPKKREIPSSTLPSESRSTDNLAWLASVAGRTEGSGVGGLGAGHRGSTSSTTSSSSSAALAAPPPPHSDGPQYKSLFSSSSSSDSPSPSSSSSPSPSPLKLVSSLPAVYTSSPLSQSTVGSVHYAQLPPHLQFIPSPYSAPYAGYISPQLLPPPPPPPLTSSSSHRLPQAKHDQQRARLSMPPPSSDPPPSSSSSSSSRTLPSPPHPVGGAHHHHHAAVSHMVLQYTDGHGRKEEAELRPRELHNGELERGSGGRKSRDSAPPTLSLASYEARPPVLPQEFAPPHDPPALRTSITLTANSHAGDHHQMAPPRASPDKTALPLPPPAEKGGILLGKPVHRGGALSSSSASSFTFPPPLSVNSLKANVGAVTSSPQTVIQTTHNATEPLAVGLPAAALYPQTPIIGYIAGSNGGGQHGPISYHHQPPHHHQVHHHHHPAGLQQHLLIPGGSQPVIIPVSGGGVTALEPVASHMTSAALPHTYIAAAALKAETLEISGAPYHHQAQLHLPIIPAPPATAPSAPPLLPPPPPPLPTSTSSGAAASPPALPPYFIKGSIIQLANGELKRVEDLKTEDFIQSAEISSELKIDSSTVERIEGSHSSPNFAVVQFSVGEHRAQVSVEVLVEYPFFVFGQGWSSCCPDRTTQLLELPCTKLSVGDVCISLTLKNLRNGSLRKTPAAVAAEPIGPTPGHSHLKANNRSAVAAARERENGIGQRVDGSGRGSGEKNGELPPSAPNSQVTAGRSMKPPGGRKRRWSAPEGRKVEKAEEEPPLTLPKPSFIPHEVKVSIEGRSSVGK